MKFGKLSVITAGFAIMLAMGQSAYAWGDDHYEHGYHAAHTGHHHHHGFFSRLSGFLGYHNHHPKPHHYVSNPW